MIRIAQDDAPFDQFIDLGAYGVVLDGTLLPTDNSGQPPSKVMGPDINYGAKYQQQQFRDDATSADLPPLPSLQPQQSVDWKPVVHSVRGANPPVPPTPLPGHPAAADGAAPPPAPGFNQDEPWKFAAPVSGQSNPSISSYSRPGSGIAAAAAAQARQPGDQNDEPPLPSLPAHLFEGLPPRPNVSGNQNPGGPGQSPMSQSSQMKSSSFQGQPSPWDAPTSDVGVTTGTSNASISTTDGWKAADPTSDGWKSAGIPGSKALPSLPSPSVPSYQSSRGGPYTPEVTSTGTSIPSTDSFTSGSIRVDALAREIAHAQANLPPAIPGFEPYSQETGSVAQRNAGFQPQQFPSASFPDASASSTTNSSTTNSSTTNSSTTRNSYASFGRPDHIPEDSNLAAEDEFPDEYANDNKPWPKARPKAIEETDDHDPIDPEVSQSPSVTPSFSQLRVQIRACKRFRLFNHWIKHRLKHLSKQRLNNWHNHCRSQALPADDLGDNDEQNAFINFESEAETKAPHVENVDSDDREIAALFEGEPVNAFERKDETNIRPSRPSEPAYMAWLEPAPDDEDTAPPVAETAAEITSESYAESASSSSPEIVLETNFETASQFSFESNPVSNNIETASDQTKLDGDRARLAIEEGFRQAQAAVAASQVNLNAIPDSMVTPVSLPPQAMHLFGDMGGANSSTSELNLTSPSSFSSPAAPPAPSTSEPAPLIYVSDYSFSYA